jgi:hypothetical protein
MRLLISSALLLSGVTLWTGCTIEHDREPVVVEHQSEPTVIKEKEVVHDRPVVIEKQSAPAPAPAPAAPPPKVEINNNVDR